MRIATNFARETRGFFVTRDTRDVRQGKAMTAQECVRRDLHPGMKHSYLGQY